MVAVTVRTRGMLVGSILILPRLTPLIDQRGDRGFARALGRFRHGRPKDAKCGAQRDKLEQERAGEKPGHAAPLAK